MKIKTQDYNEVTVVDLHGEFTAEFVKSFEDIAVEIVHKKRSWIVLDVSSVTFMDSRALEKILWLRDYCIQNNCQLKLAGLDENCSKILEVTRLHPQFDIYEELATAVKSFA